MAAEKRHRLIHELPALEHKLRLLYGRHGEIKSRGQLLKRLEWSEARATETIRGKDGRAPGKVTQTQLDQLVELLVEIEPERMSIARAEKLWLGPLGPFASVLQPSVPSLRETLLGCERRLKVSLYMKRDGMGIINDAVELPEDTETIRQDDGIAFEVEGTPGHRLLVLCHSNCWQVVVPGHLHAGLFEGTRTRLPRQNWIVNIDAGLSEVYFIELVPEFEPNLPRDSRQVIEPRIADELASQLQSETWAGRWRCGRKAINVVAKRSRSST